MFKKYVLIAAFLPILAYGSDIKEPCKARYMGEESLWSSIEHNYVGIPTGLTEYFCKDCDKQSVQIRVSNGFYLSKSYQFDNQDDFISKADSKYTREDIVKLALSDLSPEGLPQIKFKVNDIEFTSFTFLGNKNRFVTYAANNQSAKDIIINYRGFITASNGYTCSVIVSYYGDEMNSKSRASISYFMNNLMI